MNRLYKIFALACGLLLAPSVGARAQESEPALVGQDELGGRRALVGPGCVVNQLATNVQLLSGISDLDALIDEDLDNFATFTTGVGVGVTEQPLFSVADLHHTYRAGTEAGICMVSSESGGLLSLSVIQLFSILVYNNGELVETISDLESGQSGTGVALDLIKIPGSDNMAVNLTCTPSKDFDELYVVLSGGLDVSVIKQLKFKYAFVGHPIQCLLTDNGIKEYAKQTGQDVENAVVTPVGAAVPVLIPFPIIDSETDKLVDDQLDNSCSVTNILSIGYKGAVKLSTSKTETACGVTNNNPDITVRFPAGSEVGFVYQNASALDLKLGNYVEIKVFNTDGTTQTERVEAGVLSLGVAEGGKMTSSVIADKEFYAAEIEFYTGVSANLGNLGVYYGFVNEPPAAPGRCDINPSVDAEMCATQTTYQLLSNPAVAVTWELESAQTPAGDDWTQQPEWTDNAVTVTPSGSVTFHDVIDAEGQAETIYDGFFTFKATAVGCPHTPQCTATVMITRGVDGYSDGCAVPVTDEKYTISTSIHGSSGSLISISNMGVAGFDGNPDYESSKDAEKWRELALLDESDDTYITYEGGLSLASNMQIIGVKTTDGSTVSVTDVDGEDVGAKRIGFIVESAYEGLSADVLQFYVIRCYKGGEIVYEMPIDEANAVGVGLISGTTSSNTANSNKVRYSIEVPAVVAFDEFTLWTAGVLQLNISKLNIYNAFVEDAAMHCSDPLKCAEFITSRSGATAYPMLPFQTASVAGAVQNVGFLIDDEGENADGTNRVETYFNYQNTVEAGSGLTVVVKLGKTLDYRHQLGIVMDSQTFLAGVELGSWMTVETYFNGQPTGDRFDDWSVLGLNLIGYGDKRYLVNQPTRNFDEVRITFAGVANVLNSSKLYGLFVRGDKNLNGIPDCTDPDQTCAEDLNLQATRVCVGGGQPMVLTGEHRVVQKIFVTAPDQQFDSRNVEEGELPYIEVSPDKPDFQVEIPVTTAGNSLNLMVYDYDTGRYLDGLTYTVYPARAEWRRTPINTDWNEPNNWDGNVPPYCCTNVVIPDGATRYPVLQSAAAGEDPHADNLYCCAGIYFKASPDGGDAARPAQVVNVPELAYEKAWVDVRMMPNRYYLFAAPLKQTYTGDLFVPAAMNGQQTGLEFTDLDNDNTPQNRFNPRIYQRMWKTQPEVRLLDNLYYSSAYAPDGDGTVQLRQDAWKTVGFENDATVETAEWSTAFNAMSQVYATQGQPQNGYSVWVDNGTLPADQAVIMRLPKQHAYYNYYTPDGGLLPEHEGELENDYPYNYDQYTDKTKLDRAENTRFVYEPEAYGNLQQADVQYAAKKSATPFDASSGLLTVKLQTGDNNGQSGVASSSFVANNPFMSDVDILTFLQTNTNVKSVGRYNGNTYESYTLAGDGLQLISTQAEDGDDGPAAAAPQERVIHPMEAFFVDLGDGNTGYNTSVSFTREMMLATAPADEEAADEPAAALLPLLRVTARANGQQAAMVVADSTAGATAETLLDADVAPAVAVFAADGNKARDITSTSRPEIALGVVMTGTDTLTLRFSAEGGADLADWELLDQATGTTYALQRGVTLTDASTSVGRLVLRSRSRLAAQAAQRGHRAYVSCRGAEAVATPAAGQALQRLEVYTLDGRRYAAAQAASGQSTVAAPVPPATTVLLRVTLADGSAETFKLLTPGV